MPRSLLSRSRAANAVEYVFVLVFLMIAVAVGYRVVGRASNTANGKASATLDGNLGTGGGIVATGGAGAAGGAGEAPTGAATQALTGNDAVPTSGPGGAPGGGGGGAAAPGNAVETPYTDPMGVVYGPVVAQTGAPRQDPVTRFATGFFVDGAWGTIHGIGSLGYNLVTDPVGTGRNIGSGVANVVMHPIDTASSVAANVRQEFRNDPARATGNLLFQVGTIFVPASRAGTVARLGRGAEAAEALSPGARVGAAAARTERIAANECPGGRCLRPGSCFAAGTPVVTEHGALAIENVAVGDVVLARDPETGATSLERVARTFVREAPVVDLELAAANDAHEHIVVTLEHPFFVHGRGFRAVADLAPGDEVDTALGTASVVALASLPETRTVYNFEVEHAHTYFVGKTAAWVHNQCDAAAAARQAAIDRAWPERFPDPPPGARILSSQQRMPIERVTGSVQGEVRADIVAAKRAEIERILATGEGRLPQVKMVPDPNNPGGHILIDQNHTFQAYRELGFREIPAQVYNEQGVQFLRDQMSYPQTNFPIGEMRSVDRFSGSPVQQWRARGAGQWPPPN